MSNLLPERPNLEHLKAQAKDLLSSFRAGSDRERVHAVFPEVKDITLSDSQLVIAREYGFESWPKLKAHVDLHAADLDRRERADTMAKQLVTNQWEAAAALLASDPSLGEATLAAACATGKVEAVTRFLDESPGLISTKIEPNGWTPICYVSFSRLLRTDLVRPRLVETARQLIDKGADVDDFWMTPEGWHEACIYGATGCNDCPELAEVLLKAGAAPNDLGHEAFYHSCELSRPDCLRLLIQYGGKIGEAMNGLARLCDFEKPDWLQMVLDMTPDKSELPQVIPHALRRARSDEFMKILIESGVDLSAPHDSGLTPYQAAIRMNRKKVAEMIAENGGDTTLRPSDALIGKILAGEEIDPASVSKETIEEINGGHAPQLCQWGANGLTDATERLLALGADPNVKDGNGFRPLHEAAHGGNVDTVKVLLKYGADPTAIDNVHGGTPAGFACAGSNGASSDRRDAFIQVIQTLLDAGCPLPRRAWGSPEVVEFLVSKGVPKEG